MSQETTPAGQFTRKSLEEQAIRMALDGSWEEAERLNRMFLEQFPDNIDALNRLGKALMEQGLYKKAYETYGRTLELDRYNRIARKNRVRLEILIQAGKSRNRTEATEREQVLPDLFISESGKSAVVPLRITAPRQAIEELARGEPVRLEATEETVLVKTEDGSLLGRLDPRVSHRLSDFIQKGNRYTAAIAEIKADSVKVFVRETHQHPQLVGRLSFPPQFMEQVEIVRPYIRDWGLRLQEAFESDLGDDEEEVEEDEEELGSILEIDEDDEEIDDDFDDEEDMDQDL